MCLKIHSDFIQKAIYCLTLKINSVPRVIFLGREGVSSKFHPCSYCKRLRHLLLENTVVLGESKIYFRSCRVTTIVFYPEERAHPLYIVLPLMRLVLHEHPWSFWKPRILEAARQLLLAISLTHLCESARRPYPHPHSSWKPLAAYLELFILWRSPRKQLGLPKQLLPTPSEVVSWLFLSTYSWLQETAWQPCLPYRQIIENNYKYGSY